MASTGGSQTGEWEEGPSQLCPPLRLKGCMGQEAGGVHTGNENGTPQVPLSLGGAVAIAPTIITTTPAVIADGLLRTGLCAVCSMCLL